jgi:hypothetical protein
LISSVPLAQRSCCARGLQSLRAHWVRICLGTGALQDMGATKVRAWTNRRFAADMLLTPTGLKHAVWRIMDARLSYVCR